MKKEHIKYLKILMAVTIAIIIVAIPTSTETMIVNKKIKRILHLKNLGLNQINIYQENPNLPIKQNESNQFRIIQIGDSHIQAGFLTGETRRLLANYCNDSAISIGFTFPYNLAGTNSPADYTFKSSNNWSFTKIITSNKPIGAGISGIIMETTDKNPSIIVSLKNPKLGDKNFDEVTIFYNDYGNEFSIELEGLKSEIISKGDNFITIKLANHVAEANIKFISLNNDSSHIAISGFMLINSSSKIVYSSAGLNGADVESYLLANELTNHLQQINPKLIIISLGTNDAYHPRFNINTFSQNLDSLIKKAKAVSPNATILLTIPGDHLVSRTNLNPNLLEVKDAIINLAVANNCCVWDFHSIMGGEGSIKTWNNMGLTAPDLLHLNAKGYQLQGELFFEALIGN